MRALGRQPRAGPECKQNHQHEANVEDAEQHFGDAGRDDFDVGKAKHAHDQRDNEEDDRPLSTTALFS